MRKSLPVRFRFPHKRLVLAGWLAIGLSALFGGESYSTGPVGILLLPAAAPSVSGIDTFVYLGQCFLRPATYRGIVTANSGATLLDDLANWSNDQFATSSAPCLVEIVSGPNAGLMIDIESNTSSTLVLSRSFATTALVGQAFRIRPHSTLATIFGATGESGLVKGDEGTADVVSLWNGFRYDEFYLSDAGWRAMGDRATDRSATVVAPGEAIFLKHRAAMGGTVTVIGEVARGSAALPILPGFNLVTPLTSEPLSLGTAQLFTGNTATGLKGGAPTTADVVSIWNGTSLTDYYYRVTTAGNVGWRKAGDVSTDQASVLLPAGAGFIIKRKADLPAFLWQRPGVN